MADQKNAFLTYKGKPLVRQGNTLYYGNMYDPFVVMLTITKSEKKGDLDIAEKVRVQLMNTDPTCPPTEIIVKTAERPGLYPAMAIGSTWLEKAYRTAMRGSASAQPPVNSQRAQVKEPKSKSPSHRTTTKEKN